MQNLQHIATEIHSSINAVHKFTEKKTGNTVAEQSKAVHGLVIQGNRGSSYLPKPTDFM